MLITSRGVGLLATATCSVVAGFGLGYPELVVLGTTGIVAVGFAVAYALWRPALRVHRVAEPDRVSRGERSRMTLTVRNDGRLPATTLLARDRCGARAIPVPLVRLRPRDDSVVDYPVPTGRRGVLPIGPLTVTRRDPLGLASAGRRHGGTVRVWVYPRILPLTAVPAGVARSLDGRVDRVPHGSITFDTLREYVIGDELRRVHWRTSARVGELMVREHLDTSLPRMVVLLDNRVSAYPRPVDGVAADFESACEAAASVVTAAVREELPVALYLVAGRPGGDGTPTPAIRPPAPPPGSGPASGSGQAWAPAFVDSDGRRVENARPFLDLLAEAELGDGSGMGSLRLALDRLRHRQTGDTLLFLTGPGGRTGLAEVASLSGRYPALLAAVFDRHTTDQTISDQTISDQTGGYRGGMAGGGNRPDRLVVLDARDGDDFAAGWEGVRGW